MGGNGGYEPPPPRARIRPRRRSSALLATTAAAAISLCGTSCAAANEKQHIPFKTGTRNNGDVPSFRKPTADPPVLPNHNDRILDTDAANSEADPMPQSYIIGGTDLPNPAAHPWFAATKFTQNIDSYTGTEHTYDNSHHHPSFSSNQKSNLHALQSWLGCGASLVASRFIVTAAHCVWDPYQDPRSVASGQEKRLAMDPLAVGLEYRVGFTGYCPDQLLSRNTSGEKKDAIMEAAGGGGGAGGESRLHVEDEGGGIDSDGSYGSESAAATTPSPLEENCGQPYEDIPAVAIHLHPAHPDTGSVIDLAIVELAYPSTITPVALDATGSVLSTIEQGSRMTVLGAGKTHGRYTYSPSQWNAALPDELQSVEVGRVPVQHCVDHLPGLLDHGHLDGSMICSVSLSLLDNEKEKLGTACHGDSGGPLIVRRPKEPSTSTSTTNLRQKNPSSSANSTATSSTPNQDILLGVVSVGKQNCNGEATAYTSISYASGWMCSVMCQDSMGLIAFQDCPDWCYDEENGRYHGEVMGNGDGGSAIFGFTGESHDGDEGGGGATAYGLEKQQGRAHAFVDEDDKVDDNSRISANRGNAIDCEAEGNLEFLFRSKSKSCRWLGKSDRSPERILRICSKTDAQNVCAGTCRPGNDRCVYSS